MGGVTPKSSILTGFSLINHPAIGGTTILGNPHIIQMMMEALQGYAPHEPNGPFGQKGFFAQPSCTASKGQETRADGYYVIMYEVFNK